MPDIAETCAYANLRDNWGSAYKVSRWQPPAPGSPVRIMASAALAMVVRGAGARGPG